MNLVELVQGQLSADVIGKLAGMLGTNSDTTRTAVTAAVPTLLGAFGSVASPRDGASRPASTLDSLDTSVQGNVMQSLANGKSFQDLGTKLLGSLFGSEMLSGLANALGHFTGLGSGSTASLLAVLTPIVLGVLKRHTQGMGASASELTQLLEGQKQNIMDAMPSSLSNTLAGVSGISGLTDWARGTAGSAYQAGRTAVSETARTAHATVAAGASARRWALPVLALLILGGVLWWWGSSSTPPPSVSMPPPSLGTDQVARLTGQVTDFFRSATDTFAGIKDAASAEMAVPKLRELSTTLDTLRFTMNQLSVDARAKLVALVQDLSAKLMPTLDSAVTLPAVGNTVKPFVDELRRKLNAMVTA
jgi:Bacterial protein of unknown function (DUF937)